MQVAEPFPFCAFSFFKTTMYGKEKGVLEFLGFKECCGILFSLSSWGFVKSFILTNENLEILNFDQVLALLLLLVSVNVQSHFVPPPSLQILCFKHLKCIPNMCLMFLALWGDFSINPKVFDAQIHLLKLSHPLPLFPTLTKLKNQV